MSAPGRALALAWAVSILWACRSSPDELARGSSAGGASVGDTGPAVDAAVSLLENSPSNAAGAPSDAGPFPSEPPTPGPAGASRLPAIRRATLENGVQIAFVEHAALPVLHVRVLLRGAGSLFDPPARPGLASMTADLLREGAGAMDSRAVAEAFDSAGARLSTETSEDAVTLSLDTLPDRAEATVTLLAKLLTEPTFRQDELDRLRRRELDRLSQELADPTWLSLRPFFRAVYGAGHPYGRFDTTPAALRAITRDDVVGFHREHVRGGAVTVVAVGSMAPDAFTALARTAFERLPSGAVSRPVMPAPPPRAARAVFIVDRAESQQAYVRVGRLGPPRADERWPALAVANQVLGASPSSRLFVDLRERRSLTYGVYARVRATVGEGTVSAAGSTRLDRAGDFTRALLEHLDRMGAEPVADDELTRARLVVQHRFPTSIATADDLADRVSELSLFGLGDDYFDRYRSSVSAVTAAAVRDAGERYYQSQRSVIVVVGPARRLRPMLSGLGAITVLRPGE